MGDWPPTPWTGITPSTVMVTNPKWSIGSFLQAISVDVASAAWPSANLAIFVPFVVPATFTVAKILFSVTTQAGNYDVGVYDPGGNRLTSLGTTALPAAGITGADVADVTLNPGLYYVAMACSVITNSLSRFAPPNASLVRATGVYQMATALPLPATATFAVATNAYIPSLALTRRTLV